MNSPEPASSGLLRRLLLPCGVVLAAAGIVVWQADRRPLPLGDQPPPEAFVAVHAITSPDDAAFFRIALTPEVYQDLSSPAAQDLAVVDADGRAMPIRMRTPVAPGVPTTVTVPLPPVHRVPDMADPKAAEAWRIALIEPSTAGASLAIAPAAPEAQPVWVVDGRATGDAGLDGLRFDAATGSDIAIRLRVEASDDLLAWRGLSEARPVLRLGTGPSAIELRDIDVPRTRAAWLRLSVVDGQWPSALGDPAVTALRRNVTREELPEWIESSTGVVEPGRRYAFKGPGALPVESVAVRLPPPGGAVGFRLLGTGAAPERLMATGTAWRVEMSGGAIENPAVSIAPMAPGPLALALDGAADAPRLAWRYRPATVLVMASGRPPYRLLAGHAGPPRPTADLDTPLAAYLARTGLSEAPTAALGARTVTGGEAARATVRTGRIALWAVLVLAAAGLGLMAWRQLREPAVP